MIKVLCFNCNTHLANTDVQRLDWPLDASMFSVAYPGWYLRQGMLNLDLWCPACGQFPFSHDPYTAGGNAVGKNLNIRGTDGKPVLLTIKQILLNSRDPALSQGEPSQKKPMTACEPDSGGPEKLPQYGRGSNSAVGNQTAIPDQKPAFPCPLCGAKKRFHKKGCPIIKAIPVSKSDPQVLRSLGLVKEVVENEDPHVQAVMARVLSGPDKGDTSPTAAEIKELEEERLNRRTSRQEDDLRPGEGYTPQGVNNASQIG